MLALRDCICSGSGYQDVVKNGFKPCLIFKKRGHMSGLYVEDDSHIRRITIFLDANRIYALTPHLLSTGMVKPPR